MSAGTDDPLANPVWHALTGRQAGLAVGTGDARTYRPEIARFSAIRQADEGAYAVLARLLRPGEEARLVRPPSPEPVPAGWKLTQDWPIVQMVADGAAPAADEAAPPEGLVHLGPADGEEMLALATLTDPGPFERETVRLGGFVGIRRDGRLIAMAGHRMKPPGHVEVSGVCTHPEYRGQGLATALILLVMRGIREAGEIPMLHAHAGNEGAQALYRRLGFRLSRELAFRWLRPPT